MPLTSNDQMNVLYDLLSEHSEECCGSISECEQIQRIVRSLLAKRAIDNEEFLHTLPQIYTYGEMGVSSNDLDKHIQSHQAQLTEWVSSMQTLRY